MPPHYPCNMARSTLCCSLPKQMMVLVPANQPHEGVVPKFIFCLVIGLATVQATAHWGPREGDELTCGSTTTLQEPELRTIKPSHYAQ